MSGQSFQCRPHTYHTLDFTMIVQYQKWPSTNQNWIEEKKNNSDLAVFLIIFFSKIRPDTWFESNWRGNHDIYSFIYDTLRGSSSSPFGGKKKGLKWPKILFCVLFRDFLDLWPTHAVIGNDEAIISTPASVRWERWLGWSSVSVVVSGKRRVMDAPIPSRKNKMNSTIVTDGQPLFK